MCKLLKSVQRKIPFRHTLVFYDVSLGKYFQNGFRTLSLSLPLLAISRCIMYTAFSASNTSVQWCNASSQCPKMWPMDHKLEDTNCELNKPFMCLLTDIFCHSDTNMSSTFTCETQSNLVYILSTHYIYIYKMFYLQFL